MSSLFFLQDTVIDTRKPFTDDFILQLTPDDARQLVDLLKIFHCGRTPLRDDVLTPALLSLAAANVQVKEMLLEVCVTELEDVCVDQNATHCTLQPVVQESPHPYKV